MIKELKPPVVTATNGSEAKSITTEKEETTMSNTTNTNGNQQPNSKKIELTAPIIKPLEGIFKDATLLKELNTYSLTDAGNAECFAFLYKDYLRYCKSIKKWMTWDGFRWKVDTDAAANRAAIFTARARKAAATYINNDDTRKMAELWAKNSESVGRRSAMLNTAIHLNSIEIQIDKFDQNPFLAGLKNGTLDLDTGEFRESKREDYITMQFNVEYDAKAKAPRWEQFLEEIFAGDKELIAYMQRLVGYILTGDTSEQKLFIGFGSGANGKSVFADVVTHLLGDYSDNCSFSTFEANKRNEATNDLAKLKGKRFVTVIETNEDKRLDEARVKAVTGQDLITARYLYAEFFSFRPTFKIFIAVNHKPLIKGTDDGIWRRLDLIPFKQNFIGKADPYLISKLIDELPGILNWAIQCLKELKEKRLGTAKAIEEASDKYRKESDLLQQWIDETLTFNPDGKVSCINAYESFLTWCIERSYPRWSMNSFARAMSEKGFQRKSDGKTRKYIGIYLG